MAKKYGENAAVDFAPANLMSFGKSFATLNGQPLSKSEVWYDKAALEAFALTDAAYVGQKVVFVDTENSKVYHYSIEIDGTLKELGSSLIGDEKTIRVADDGTISLFGIEGLEFQRTNEENETVSVTYQPLLVNGSLTWVEPSTTTVEGLSSEIEGLKTRLATLEGTGEGSVKKIAEDAAAASINDFATKVSDNNVVDTFKELVDYVADHGTEAADMAADILALQGDIAKKVDKEDGKGLSSNDFTTTLKEKLEALDTTAEANIIEVVKLNGVAVSVEDKEVNIPLASDTIVGLVKGSTKENEIAISTEGTMSVNSLNVNKLVQTEGDMLILDGGHV